MGRSDETRTKDGAGTSHARMAVILVAVVAGMLGMSYAAVPLYRIFCQVTGYGGTTQRAEKAPDTILDRRITVRFDANVSRDLGGWRFKPMQRKIEVRIGETKLAFYRAINEGDKPLRGTASFNVTPEIAGSYFNKIACFCFTDQTLAPGEAKDMPVQFFIDPDIMKDPDAKGLYEITLSYTFHPAKIDADKSSGKEAAVRGAKGALAPGGKG